MPQSFNDIHVAFNEKYTYSYSNPIHTPIVTLYWQVVAERVTVYASPAGVTLFIYNHCFVLNLPVTLGAMQCLVLVSVLSDF